MLITHKNKIFKTRLKVCMKFFFSFSYIIKLKNTPNIASNYRLNYRNY